MERQLGMRVLEPDSDYMGTWIAVAYEDTVLDDLYKRWRKYKLPDWKYCCEPDGTKGEYRFQYLTKHYMDFGKEKVVDRRVILYGFERMDQVPGELIIRVRRSFRRHGVRMARRCKHGRVLSGKQTECAKCRLEVAREWKNIYRTVSDEPLG